MGVLLYGTEVIEFRLRSISASVDDNPKYLGMSTESISHSLGCITCARSGFRLIATRESTDQRL